MKPLRAIDMTHAVPVDGRGQRSPVDVLARSVRDHLLRTAAHKFCAGMSDRAAAGHMHTKLDRYRLGAWRRDRFEAQCPDRHRGRRQSASPQMRSACTMDRPELIVT